MKVLITLGPDEQVSQSELQYTIYDAMREFQTNRGPNSQAYVERRYSDIPYLNTAEKVEQVERRKMLAEAVVENLEIVREK